MRIATFATYPDYMYQKYWGDWGLPGIYALHHIPTGLEYVGASNCVKARLATHAKSDSPWRTRLSACVAAKSAGPLIVDTGDNRVLLCDEQQICSQATNTLASALQVLQRPSWRMKGVRVEFSNADIIPLFLEHVEEPGLASAEIRHIQLRRPLLNGTTHVNYPGSSRPARKFGCLPSACPPSCPPLHEIKAIPILSKAADLMRMNALATGQLYAVRQKIKSAIRAKVLADAMEAGETAYLRALAVNEDAINTLGLDMPSTFSSAIQRL